MHFSGGLARWVVGGAAALGTCAPSMSDFVGMVVTSTVVTYVGLPTPGDYRVYQVFARFEGPTDTVLNAFNFRSLSGDQALTGFWHKDNASMPAFSGYGLNQDFGIWNPSQTGAVANRLVDSYLTIGGLPTGTNTTNADPSWTSGGNADSRSWNRPDIPNNGTLGWFNSNPPNLQGRVGQSGNTATDVRIGQFTVAVDDTVDRLYELRLGYNNGMPGSPVQFATGVFRLCPETTLYRDLDGDGFGSLASGSIAACEGTVGYVANDLDCNDADSSINPNTRWFVDSDSDGLGSSPNGTLTQCLQPGGYVRQDGDNCPSIANPGQEDCNGNRVGDACELASGGVDCNGNGLVDTCEIAAGSSSDCDLDGRPDECEGAVRIDRSAGPLSLSASVTADYTFAGLDRAYGALPRLTIEARADLGAPSDGILVTLDGGAGSTYFVADGLDCPAGGNTVTLEIPLAAFNAMVADGELQVRVSGFGAVNSANCPDGGIRFRLRYDGLPALADCNGNGVLDSCEIGTGLAADCNVNGVPDACDISSGLAADCNGNGRLDACDIAGGTSSDLDGNGRPDDCSGEFVVGGSGFASIVAAVNNAPVGATVWVGPGTRTEAVIIQRQVILRSTAGAASTILDGTGNMLSSFAIFGAAAHGTVIDGFTIRNGPTGTELDQFGGGAIALVQANVVIRNCVFAGNRSALGGAVYGVLTASTIEDCRFESNAATSAGGAICLEFADGWVIRNCQFTSNTSAGEGGAIALRSASGLMVGCRFEANAAQGNGGAAAVSGASATASRFADCALEGNSAALGGGIAIAPGGLLELFDTRLCRNLPDNVAGDWIDLGGNIVGFDCNQNGVCDADELAAGTQFDCDGNGVLDACDLAAGGAADCNTNGIPDSCDIAGGASSDVDSNGIPDECKPDCDSDGVPDAWEIEQGDELDCNANGVPDRCDVAQNPALDCNGNEQIDSCEGVADPTADCDGDGVIDSCEIAQDPALDCNGSGRIDACEIASNPGVDCDGNARIDSCDIAAGAEDKNANGRLDSCELRRGDLNLDGRVDGADLALLLNLWGWVNPPVGDLDGDGVVGGADLAVMLNNWGPTA
jgi:hypothetical protein